MNLRFWSFRCGFALASLFLSQPAASVAADGKAPPRRAIELRETNSVDVLSTLRNQANGPRVLEDDFTRALPNGGSRGSLDGIAAPVYSAPRVIQPRRSKDPLEQAPDWLKQADLIPGAGSKSEWLQNSAFADDASRKKSARDRLYRRLRAEESREIDSLAGDDPGSPRRRFGLSEPNSKEDTALPSGIKSSEEKLKNLLLGDDNSGATVYRGSASDSFGVGSAAPFPGQTTPQKTYMEEYRKLWGPATLAISPNPLDPFSTWGKSPAQAGTSPSPTYTGMDDAAAGARRDTGVGLPGTMNSVLHPTALPGANDQLNQWNPLYVPPRIEASKPAAPISVPMMETPRRRF